MRRVLVVCEAQSDFQIATALCERTLQEEGPDWFRDYFEHSAAHVLAWNGTDASQPFVPWKRLRDLRGSLGVRPPLGHFTAVRALPTPSRPAPPWRSPAN